MARTIATIQQSMITQVAATPVLAGVMSSSIADILNMLIYVVAVSQWALENLFDLHKAEVAASLKNERVHKMGWFIQKALAFQSGYSLVAETDTYDNSALTDAQIAASQVVKYAAVQRVPKALLLKVANVVAGEIVPLTTPQLNQLKAYFGIVGPAGVYLQFRSAIPDNLKLELTIYYDPLVLDAAGSRIDGTAPTPVKDAVSDFLVDQNQSFNGLFVPTRLIDQLQDVDGVVIPILDSCQTKFGALPYVDVGAEYRPDAGYLKIYNPGDLVIIYIPHDPL